MNPAGAVMGAMTVVIGGDLSGLDRAMKTGEKSVGGFAKSIGGVAAGALAGFAAAAVAAGAALATALTKRSLETIDAQSKLAYRLNGTVKDLQSLVLAGDLAGVSQEQLTQSVGRLNQRLAEAARTSSGPAYDALQRLGLSAKGLLDLPVDERLAVLADRFKTLGYTTAQQADVLKQFGIRGQEIISLFEGGGDTIRQARKDVEDFGIAVSDIDAVQIEMANDAWTTAGQIFTGIGNQIAVRLAPLLKAVADWLADSAREAGGFGDAIEGSIRVGIKIFNFLAREIRQVRIDWDEFMRDTVDGWNAIANFAPNLYEKIFGVKVSDAERWLHPIEQRWGKLRDELGPPATDEQWNAWFDNLKAKTAATAKEIVDQRKITNAGGGPQIDPSNDADRKRDQEKLSRLQQRIATEDEAIRVQRERDLALVADYERRRVITSEQAAAMRLEVEAKSQKAMDDLIFQRLESGIVTEQDILTRKYAQQLELLNQFEANRTLTVERAAELRRQIEERAALDIAQVQASQYSQLAGIVDTAMGDMTALIGEEGDKQFFIFKAISAATALVKGYEAVVSAFAAGNKLGGPPVGFAFAGIAAAGVAAQIAKLMSVGPKSGGVPTGAAGGGSDAAAAAPAAAPAAAGNGQTMFLTIGGQDMFTRESVRNLAGKLIDFQRDGGQVVLQGA